MKKHNLVLQMNIVVILIVLTLIHIIHMIHRIKVILNLKK